MKQTNNAIKFLMAQYRAIFKNAYLKGMASALVLTASLAAAGAAQADTLTEANWGSLEAGGTYAVDGTSSAENSFDNFSFSGSSPTANNNAFTLNISSGTNTIDASTAGAALTVQADNATINLSGDTATNAALSIKGAGSSSGATLQVGTFNLGNGQLTLESAGSAAADAASLIADTILVTGGTNPDDSKIIFSGSSAEAAILKGRLDSTGAGENLTTLDFSSGSGTLSTFTNDNGAAVNVTVATSQEAVLDLTPATGTAADPTKTTLKLVGGTFDLQGNDSSSGGKFTVKYGTLDIGDDVALTNSESGANMGIITVSGTATADATLRLSSAQLKSFLAADKGINGDLTADDFQGAVVVNSGSIYLSDSTKAAVDISQFTFSSGGTGTAGALDFGTAGEAGFIAGDKLAVSTAISSGANVNIKANTLTLGNANLDTSADDYDGFGFSSATVQELNLVQAEGVTTPFAIKNALNFSKTKEIDNPYKSGTSDPAKITVADNGVLSNTDFKLDENGAMTIRAGNFTNNVDVTISSGSLSVGLGDTAAGTAGVQGVDASLTFAAGTSLILDNAKENTITVQGNGSPTTAWANGLTRNSTGTLDLRQAAISFASDTPVTGTDYKSTTTINVNDDGLVLVTDDQMDYLLNNIRDSRDTASISGAGFLLSGSGTVQVDGDLTLAVTDVKSGSAVEDNTVVFNGGGYLEAETITISSDPDNRLSDFIADNLDIGDGTLRADSLVLNNNHLIDASSGLQESFNVDDGNLVVGSTLSSVNSHVVLGNGTSGSSLTLGYINSNTDQYGIALPESAENAYTLSAESGTVQPNLVLSGGTTGQESKLDVVYGDWAVQDINATNAIITVGAASADQKHDIEGNAYTTSLTGQGLTLNASGTMTVNSNATATFETLALNGGSITVDNTTLTINGDYVAQVEDNEATEENEEVPESWGLTTSTGTVTVSGRDGKLILGADAVQGISTTLTDGKYVYTNANTAQKAFVTLSDWATLSLGLGEGVTFDKDSLAKLRKNFISGNTGAVLPDGFIDIGEAQISGIDTSAGTISWNELKSYKDIIADILQTGLTNATLTDVVASDTVQANVGNVLADGATPVVTFGDATLHKANENGDFIANEKGTGVAANVAAGGHFAVYNGGKLNDVTLQAGTATSTTEFAVIASTAEDGTEPETTIKSLKAAGDNTSFYVGGKTTITNNLDVGEVVMAKDLTVNGKAYIEEGLNSDVDAEGNLVANGTLTTNGTLEVLGGAEFAGNIVAKDTATFGKANGGDNYTVNGQVYAHDYYFAGNNSFQTVNFYNGAEFGAGTTTATTVTLGDDLALYGGASLTADVLQFTTAAKEGAAAISVGQNIVTTGANGESVVESSPAYLTVNRLDLAGNSLVVDPAWDKPASIVAVGQLGAANTVDSVLGNDAGTLDGSLVALQNSILAVGVTNSTEADGLTAIEQVQHTFANYLNANGGLSTDNVGAIAYVAKSLNLDETSKVVVDSTRTGSEYLALMNGTLSNPSTADTAFKTAVTNNNAYIGANSVLAIGNDALNATRTENGIAYDRAALHFDDAEASIYGAGGKIVLTGGEFNTIDEVLLFTDNGAGEHQGVTIAADGQDIRVESLSGLYYMLLEAGSETTGGALMLDHSRLNQIFTSASAPVKNTLVTYAERNNKWADEKAPVDRLVGDLRRDVTYHADTKTFTTEVNGTVTTLDSQDYVAIAHTDAEGTTTYTVYEEAYNPVLDYTVMYDASGATAETVARMGAYAGVAQAALAAGASTYESISGRMGIGAQSSTMTFADNGQGAGLWLTPIYKNHDSDGFEAQGASYGVDMDLYGVALGADYTLNNGVRFGAMFNVGSGDADGQGAGSAVSNDFDYYGFGAYVGYSMGAFSVVGDISYTAVDNDVEANLGFDKVGASLDSTNFSIGVTGKYALNIDGMNVEPHAGLRYSTIDIDDYSVDGEQVYAHFSSQSMDVFSIPVGVTVSTDIVSGNWTVKPSFDVTLTGNFGDDEFDGDVAWDGISNHITATSTEVLDNFTYGATLGVAAQNGNFSLGLGLNYTGSSNVDELGIQANARFMF